MKKSFVIFSLILIGFVSKAQQSEFISITKNQKTVGKLAKTGQAIKGTTLEFNDFIYEFKVDTINQILFLKFDVENKAKDLIAAIGLKNDSLIWKNEFKSNNKSDLELYRNHIFKNDAYNSQKIDAKSGNVLYEVPYLVLAISYSQNIGVFYKKNILGKKINSIYGIDLQNGNVVWEKKGIDMTGYKIIRVDDQSVTFSTLNDGIHQLDLKTGKGWDYKQITVSHKSIYSYPYTYTFNTADFLNDSTSFVITSMEGLVSISESGERKWFSPILSKFHIIDPTIHRMPNKDILFIDKSQKDGAFVSRYNKNGQEVYVNYLSEYKNLLDYRVLENSVNLIFSKKIVNLSISNGNLINEVNHNMKLKTTAEIFNNVIFLENKGDTLEEINPFDSLSFLLYHKADNKIEKININTAIITAVPWDANTYFLENYYHKYRFIKGERYLIIIDDKNIKIASFLDISQYKIIKNMLYLVKENQLTKVDLNDFLE
ncbi:MAG: PQQ-binding-like beta-propeller repeat protein [Pseudarcicella sp.]|nr:PQQ-binding-like beta-propeller repeat protein [Pseudarcicella sp.]MBP6410428.1 PQQ-binding-like beta-propeller repeat protein [Pseudarcicella sp.]